VLMVWTIPFFSPSLDMVRRIAVFGVGVNRAREPVDCGRELGHNWKQEGALFPPGARQCLCGA